MAELRPLEVVELRPAYTWTCEECGRDNFGLGLMTQSENGFLFSIPQTVTCKHCATTYAAKGIFE